SGGIRVGLVGAGTPMEDIDDRVIAGDAAVAARGLLIAGTLLGRSDWVERGRRAVDFLLTNLRAGEAGVYHAWDESVPRTLGILDDQAQVLLALMECYEVSGQGLYFEHARRIARVVERDWHEPGVGFMDLAAGHDETGLLAEPMFAMQANVDIAEALLWLGRLTHDERFLQLAQETLGMFARGIEARGVTVANYARVVDRLLSAEPEFKIVAEFPAGEPDSIADPLHRAALKLALAGRTVQRLDRVADIDLMRQLGLPDVAKVAYVCMGGTCSAALTAPDQLLPAIDELIEQPFL
ncbi:MAG: AGE family epimerase/isomerase, partial [Chloroflexi bacterium]|nr:AGE family epimerase/isomerase [Chloroflexota bacterium]